LPYFVRLSGWLNQDANLYFVESYMNTVKNWVTASEVEALRKAAKKTRNPARNELVILMLYRHGLRVSELCSIQLDQLNLEQSTLFVKRSKNGIDGMHPMAGDELRLLRVNGGIKSGHWAAQKPATLGLGVTRAPRRRPVSRASQIAGG